MSLFHVWHYQWVRPSKSCNTDTKGLWYPSLLLGLQGIQSQPSFQGQWITAKAFLSLLPLTQCCSDPIAGAAGAILRGHCSTGKLQDTVAVDPPPLPLLPGVKDPLPPKHLLSLPLCSWDSHPALTSLMQQAWHLLKKTEGLSQLIMASIHPLLFSPFPTVGNGISLRHPHSSSCHSTGAVRAPGSVAVWSGLQYWCNTGVLSSARQQEHPLEMGSLRDVGSLRICPQW